MKITPQNFAALKNDYQGICTACQTVADYCEPDASGDTCETCDKKTVYGADELLLMGKITFCKTEEQENVVF